ncbi:RusA family crossover junction endodeoxyribonuclease [Phascolarctobacterium sp.]|uniref:RusA family crossover junction endodeoxyribonuclease n=1 Tax=Phascolarctobacterium sp. TaxID=2049039 RepID=UPI00386505B1
MSIRLSVSIPPSVNAAYINRHGSGKGRTLSASARTWKVVAGYKAMAEARKQGWIIPDDSKKVVLEVVAYWPDHRRRDMNNLHKLLCDALEGYLYHDDKMVLVRDMDFSVDKDNPRLELCLYVME